MPMTNAGTTGQTNNRRGHTPATYLTNATNTTDIIGDPVKVTPAVLGRQPDTTPETKRSEAGDSTDTPTPGRVLGNQFVGSGVRPPE